MTSPYLIDLHCHTKDKSYDGKIPAAELVAKVHEMGFSGIVFTDHAKTWQQEELEQVRRESGVGADFVLLAGQEVRTKVDGNSGGDLLVYGPTFDIPDGTEASEVFRHLRETNGFCIAAHPSVPMIGFGKHAGTFPVSALEIWNGRYGGKVARDSEALAEEYELPGIGGSDSHSLEDVGGGATEFAELPRTLADIKRLVQAGQCAAWRPPASERLKRWLGKRNAE